MQTKLAKNFPLLEISKHFAYDEEGVKKHSVYFQSRHNFKPNKEKLLHTRASSFYQNMRDCDVHFV